MVQEPAAKGRRSFTYRGTDTMGSPTFENEGLQLIRSTYYTCNFISISQNKNRVPRILLSSAKTLHVECPGLILHRTFNVDSLPDSKQKAPVWQTHRGTRNPKSITPASWTLLQTCLRRKPRSCRQICPFLQAGQHRKGMQEAACFLGGKLFKQRSW